MASLPVAGASAAEGTGRGRGRARARAIQAIGESEPRSESTKSPGDSSSTGQKEKVASSTHSSESTGSTGGGSQDTRLSQQEAKIERAKEVVPLAPRPDAGNQHSRAIALRANHFNVSMDKTKRVFHYDVDIKHERRDLRKEELYEAFWKTVGSRSDVFKDKYGIVYDGGKQIFATQKLKTKDDEKTVLEVELSLSRDGGPPQKVTMTLKLVGDQTLKFDKASADSHFAIQVLDVVVRAARTCPFIDSPFVAAARSFYAPPLNAPAMDLTGGLEAWCGYYCSAHIVQGYRPMLNIDSCYTAFYKKQSVVDFACDVLSGGGGGRGGRDNRSPWQKGRLAPEAFMSPIDVKMFQKQIKGLTVTITHRTGEKTRRTYRVRAVTATGAMQTMFKSTTDDGREREMSVADYFEQTYKRLRWPMLPCLACGSKSRAIYLPLEVCDIGFGQKSLKKINEEQTSKMIRVACKDADRREGEIREMAQASGLNQDQFSRSFGVQFEPKMVDIPGRLLDIPNLAYGRNSTVKPERGAWDLRGLAMHTPGSIGGWGIMCFLRKDQQRMVEAFCESLTRAAHGMGVQIDQYPESLQYVQRAQEIERSMATIVSEVEQRKRAPPGLILVCLPGRNTDLYAEVKRVADTHLGVVTQVVQFRTVAAPKPATMSNIMLKINAKIGGVNNVLVDDSGRIASRFLMRQPTLILGIDVTHPGPFDRNSPSIGAVVGNIDNLPAKFAASVIVQHFRRETVVRPTEAVKERLVQYYKCTNVKPERIIVYRDGVSEGQFPQVLREELSCLREVCNGLEEGYQPKITYIVVQKRHHTRFFCRDDRDKSGKARNVPPGTVVDQTVVHPANYDFYLCSHFGIQGTSRPAHYYVLHDDSGFASLEVQTVTYMLCHMYFRCSRTVSIPAPAYYAHLVAQRAKYHLQHKFGDWSDSGSVTSAGLDEERVQVSHDEMKKCVRLADRIKESMYFA